MLATVSYSKNRELVKERLNDPDGFWLNLRLKNGISLTEVAVVSVDETYLRYKTKENGETHQVKFDDIAELTIVEF